MRISFSSTLMILMSLCALFGCGNGENDLTKSPSASAPSVKEVKVTIGGTAYSFRTGSATDWDYFGNHYYFASSLSIYPYLMVDISSGSITVQFYKTSTDKSNYTISTSSFTTSGGTIASINWTGSVNPDFISSGGTVTGSITALSY